MTTYSSVGASEVDSDSPITDTLMAKLANNPVAIAEGDASVPAHLLDTYLLGSITTTSGTVRTLSGLSLTYFNWLYVTFTAVSFNTNAVSYFYVDVAAMRSANTTSSPHTIDGMMMLSLTNGVGFIVTTSNAGSLSVAANTGITTASTSVSFTASGGGAFDNGTIRVYGVK